MKTPVRKQKNKLTETTETTLAECMKLIIPLIVVVIPIILCAGFVILQIHHIHSSDWVSFRGNLTSATGMLIFYLLGSAPKEGVLNKFMSGH
jgi:hypothetical protein